ncbi:MAG TPA: PIN domain-containing protein [Actinomycetota bacterium]|jgi:predicted nucleic acid-binding protein|nr:PIN domain-containing protein [Actinomycetota bacterium]
MALIVLDASVLIAFLDPDDELHERSRAALHSPDVVDGEWVVPTTVCAELLVGAHRSGKRAVDLVNSFIDEGIDRVEPMTLPIARGAARIRAEHSRLSLADAFVIATGDAVKADAVLTSDAAWERVSERIRLV